MVRILDPRDGETIYDPACGTGGMLIEAIQHVKDAGGNVRTLWGKLFGQEKNLPTSSIARTNCFLHGVEDFHIDRSVTLSNSAFHSSDSDSKEDAQFQITDIIVSDLADLGLQIGTESNPSLLLATVDRLWVDHDFPRVRELTEELVARAVQDTAIRMSRMPYPGSAVTSLATPL